MNDALQRIQMSDRTDGILTTDKWACFSLAREMRRVHIVARFTIDGEPASKARARFTNYGSKVRVYTPEKTAQAQDRVGWLFRQACPGHRPDKTTTYGLAAVFFNDTRQRRDVDNMLKLLCDGLNGIAWADDSQVEEISGRRGHGHKGQARTEVLIYAVSQVDPKVTMTCVGCGTEFVTYDSWAKRKYCTRQCGVEHRRRLRVSVCKHCGMEFDNPWSGRQQYCSKDCAYQAKQVAVACIQCGGEFVRPKSLNRGKPFCSTDCRGTYTNARRRSVPKGICADCGGPTSRKDSARCRSCYATHRAGPTQKYMSGRRVKT